MMDEGSDKEKEHIVPVLCAWGAQTISRFILNILVLLLTAADISGYHTFNYLFFLSYKYDVP